jgi:DnaJ family protein B protein 13
MGKDYYQVLQLTRSAKDSDIKAAYDYFMNFFCFVIIFRWLHSYRRLALKYHPVKNTDDPNNLNKFNDICEAFDVLHDRMYRFILMKYFSSFYSDKKRAVYDQYGDEGLKNGVPMGPKNEWNEGYVYHGNSDKVFRDFFGGDNPFSGKSERQTKRCLIK